MFAGIVFAYLSDVGMLKQGRVTHKTHIVNLQLKLLPTHIRLGGEDSGKDDVREPTGRRKTFLKQSSRPRKTVVCGKRRWRTEKSEKFNLALFDFFLSFFFTFPSMRGKVELIRLIPLEFDRLINFK